MTKAPSGARLEQAVDGIEGAEDEAGGAPDADHDQYNCMKQKLISVAMLKPTIRTEAFTDHGPYPAGVDVLVLLR